MTVWRMETSEGFTHYPFADWAIKNYPELSVAQRSSNAATAAASAVASAMDSPMAVIVSRYQSILNSANDTSLSPG